MVSYTVVLSSWKIFITLFYSGMCSAVWSKKQKFKRFSYFSYYWKMKFYFIFLIADLTWKIILGFIICKWYSLRISVMISIFIEKHTVILQESEICSSDEQFQPLSATVMR